MKKNKLLIIISSIVIIYGIMGFVALPKFLKPQIEKVINENITEQASIKKVDFNPFLLKFSIHDLKIFNEKETTISVEKLLVDFSIIKSIDEQHISFKDLELVNPYINLIEYEDGTINLQKLAKEKKEEKPKEEDKNKTTSDIKFQIYKTILDNAKIKFTRLTADKEPFILNVDKLNYTFYDMGTYRNTLASHTLKILINNHSELEIKGGVRLNPFKMYGNVALKNFKPNDFLTYKKDILNFNMSKDTYLDLQFGYKVDAEKELNIQIDEAHINLRNLDIKQNDKSILSLSHLDIEDVNVQYPENTVNIDSIFLNKLNTNVISDENSILNLSNLVKKEETELPSTKTEKTDASENKLKKEEIVESKNHNNEVVEIKQSNDTKNNAWKVSLNKLDIKDSNISFNDIKNKLLLNMENINIDLQNFKLNGNDFTLEKVALSKPTITLKDEKNKLNIENKELELIVNKLESKNSIINLENITFNNSLLTFNDLKNKTKVLVNNINVSLNTLLKENENISLFNINVKTPKIIFNDKKNKIDISTDAISLNLNELNKINENIDIKSLSLSNPKIKFKDNKNKLHISTKKTDLNIASIKKENGIILVDSVNLKNPYVYLRDYKNSIKLVNSGINLNVNNFKLEKNDVYLNKAKLRVSRISGDNFDTKTNLKAKNINLIATKISQKKQRLNIGSLSLTRPDIFVVDKKANKTLDLRSMSLRINNISKYKDSIKVSKVLLQNKSIQVKDLLTKMDTSIKNLFLNVQKISHKKNKLKILRSSINKPIISISLPKKETTKQEEGATGNETKEKEVASTFDKSRRLRIVKRIEKAASKKGLEFDIGPVKIKDAKMSFEDKNLPIPFKTNITELNGEFSRLNSSNSKPTKLKLEGKVDEYGYTKITGTVDINDVKLLTDTNLLFKNIAIKNFTPYTGKFIGREIESGKLNLDLKYNIKKSDLKAQNSIIISDIKLGNNVDSPDAANLPLELAIALLEDSDGVIDLELPVSGNVDDPQFSIAPIVWKVFTNLIVKAITSPFSLLASVFGISEDKIKSLEFEFGKSEIIASEKETLDNIAKILSKKPKLAMVIKPVFDPTKDKLALQDIKFEQFLIKEMDKIPEGDAYKEALEDFYEDIDDIKDLDDVEESFIIKDKDGKEEFDNRGYVEYLRKFLASRQKVTDADLLTLAKKRVQNVNTYLTVDKKVPKESIKIEEITKQNASKAKWAVFNLDVATK